MSLLSHGTSYPTESCFLETCLIANKQRWMKIEIGTFTPF